MTARNPLAAGTGLVWQHGLVVVDSSIEPTIVALLQQRLATVVDVPGFAAVLGELTSTAGDDLPAFAVAVVAPDGSVAVTRHEPEPTPPPAAPIATPSAAPPPVPLPSTVVAPPEPEEHDDFGDLWSDHTIARSAEDAAVRAVPEPLPSPPPPVSTTPAPPDASQSARLPAPPPLRADPTLLPDEPPAATPVAGGGTDPTPTLDPDALPDGRLLAATCDEGHANPPYRPRCRVCDGLLTPLPTPIARPVLGRLLTTSGPGVELDRPVVVGRAPQAARFAGTEPPHLVAIDQPHVSAHHVALAVDGWSVSARDLNSTNGTYLRRSGQAPIRLTGDPVILQPDDIIDLGHGVRLSFEELP